MSMTEKAVETMLEKASELPEYSETTRPDTYFKSGFRLGYHQAEKDLELGWKDMSEIVKIANLLEIEWLNSTPWDGIRDWGFYKEVLKRFKERKENKL